MHLGRTLAWLAIAVGIPIVAKPQETANLKLDQQATEILSRSLPSGGIPQADIAARGYVASGTITYFWGGKEVTGPVTIKSRGADQFYLEARLPEGVRSFTVNKGRGSLTEANGKTSEIPYHNAIKAGVPILPQVIVASALAKDSPGPNYIGKVTIRGLQTQQIYIHRTLRQPTGSEEQLARFLDKNVFVDVQTNHVIKISDKTHPNDSFSRELEREFEYENYAVINGLELPTIIREKIAGSRISEIHISAISLNSELTDADFSVK